jgi:hypothetical protein
LTELAAVKNNRFAHGFSSLPNAAAPFGSDAAFVFA